MSTPAGRARDTIVDATHMVLPSETNAHGTLFGGQVCAWLDIACGIAARRHCRRPVVTASMDDIHFHAPVKLGHVVVIRAQVNAVFRTSMEVGAEVWSEDPNSGERHHTTSAFMTFVALGDDGRPQALPPLLCETLEERQREKAAHERRAGRLARR